MQVMHPSQQTSFEQSEQSQVEKEIVPEEPGNGVHVEALGGAAPVGREKQVR